MSARADDAAYRILPLENAPGGVFIPARFIDAAMEFNWWVDEQSGLIYRELNDGTSCIQYLAEYLESL